MYGPYRDVVTFPMKKFDRHDAHTARRSPIRRCAAPAMWSKLKSSTRPKPTPARASASNRNREQTTYLEWLNSRYQTKAPPGPAPRRRPASSATCRARWMDSRSPPGSPTSGQHLHRRTGPAVPEHRAGRRHHDEAAATSLAATPSSGPTSLCWKYSNSSRRSSVSLSMIPTTTPAPSSLCRH